MAALLESVLQYENLNIWLEYKSFYLFQQHRHAHAYGVLQGAEEVWVRQLDDFQAGLPLFGADPPVSLRVKQRK